MNDRHSHPFRRSTREMICSAVASLLTVMLTWSFVSSTMNVQWLGSDAVAVSYVEPIA